MALLREFIMKNNMTIKKLIILLLIVAGISWGCKAVVEDLVGPSSLGNKLGIQGILVVPEFKMMVLARQQ